MHSTFRVQLCDTLGRHALSLNNLKAGDVLIDEYPIACGPKSNTEIVCLGCCSPINCESDDSICPKCRWPLCKMCWKSVIHRPECDVFKSAKVKFDGGIDAKNCCPQLDCITPLSVLEPLENAEAVLKKDLGNLNLINLNPKIVQLKRLAPAKVCEKPNYHCFHSNQSPQFNNQRSDPTCQSSSPRLILLKKESNPEQWERYVEPMEDHATFRRESQDAWNADLVNVARYLRGPCQLTRFSEDLIMKVIGILQINAFEAKTPQGHPIRCLFPQTGILAHSCIPNTIRSIYPSDGYRIKLRALVDIKKDQQLLVSYTYILDGTAERQQHLQRGKYFTCHCERCSDPTELGSYFSSIKCKGCDEGYVSTIDPYDRNSDWKCDKCGNVVSSEYINETLGRILPEVARVEDMPYSVERLENTEKIHQKYHSLLHPLHFIQTNLRLSLIHMYGRITDYKLALLPDFLLEYKIELCRMVLEVLNIFEPGLSRSRAMTLYELHAPLALLAQRQYSCGLIEEETYKLKLEEACSILQESIDVLKYEDSSSSQGLLTIAGQKGLEQLRATIKSLSK